MTDGVGLLKKDLLEAVRHFFYKVSVLFVCSIFLMVDLVVVVSSFVVVADLSLSLSLCLSPCLSLSLSLLFPSQRAPPDVRNVVPNPDDEMSTAAVVYLCLTYSMRNFRKEKHLVKQAFTDCVTQTVEAALILRNEFSH